MAVTFAGHLLTARQNGFDIAHRDMHVGGSEASCWMMPVMSLPFWPENAPNTFSSSARRNSWVMT